MPEHYPLPNQCPRLRLVRDADPEFGETQQNFEEQIFKEAAYFNIVRFGTHNGSESATTDKFPVALALAHQKPRTLLYVVADSGRAFCMSHRDYEKFARLWLEKGSCK